MPGLINLPKNLFPHVGHVGHTAVMADTHAMAKIAGPKSPLSLSSITNSLLCVIAPLSVFLSQNPVENFPRATSRHLLVLDENSVLGDFIACDFAFAVC